jgi:hypothetical protein
MESNSRKWCKQRGLEEQRFYEMTKLRSQVIFYIKIIHHNNFTLLEIQEKIKITSETKNNNFINVVNL